MQDLARKESEIAYCRRTPEKTTLYQVFQENLNTFFDQIESDPSRKPFPWHVKRELQDYLDCGILARGFIRVYCESCKRNTLVALSCKHRGFCPSCGGRRMRERSLHLVDNVFPNVPVRQWVLAVPFNVRYFLAYNAELVTEVLNIYHRVISSWIKRQARRKGIRKAYTGSVTVIQRAGSALNLHVHFHGIFLDGYYFFSPSTGKLEFNRISPPTAEDMGKLVVKMKNKVLRLLDKKGYFDDEQYVDSAHATCLAASIQYKVAFGDRAGQRTQMLGGNPEKAFDFELKGKRCATSHGFSLHANTKVSAKNRTKLEKLCAYIARPPLAAERLSRRRDGKLLLRLKQPFADGTTYIVFEPLELIEKLAALVPPPWANLTRYHGCFAPNSKIRKLIVPPRKDSKYPFPPRLSWAEILKRSFGIDIFKCRYCGGKCKVIKPILFSEDIKAILESLKLPAQAPQIAPARPPPQQSFDWGA